MGKSQKNIQVSVHECGRLALISSHQPHEPTVVGQRVHPRKAQKI